MSVVVDPGHGGSDPGAVGLVVEKEKALAIALATRNRLQEYGLKVLMTRSDDSAVSLAERVAVANKAGAKVFLSIHINAGGGTGFESYRFPGSVEGAKLQAAIHKALIPVLADSVTEHGILTATALEAEPVDIPLSLSGDTLEAWIRDRGQKEARWYVLANTKMPGVLCECLFVDHPDDAKLLKDPAFLKKLGAAIADGVANYLGGEKVDYKVDPEFAKAVQQAREKGLSNPGKGHDYTQPLTEQRFWAIIARLMRW
ncbi:MAG: N-acetylmuramoyl-L-alanine amidase [Clostridia bacterium]|nr:N-acetylmuramoyl-L-alanine amidase [Clostridia bacterium]